MAFGKQSIDALRDQCRSEGGRAHKPNAAILDSQSMKTTSRGGEHGNEAGKKFSERKRHLLVDVVHAAGIQDRDGARLVLEQAKTRFPTQQLLWAYGSDAGQLIEWMQATCGWIPHTIFRPVGMQGFYVLPRRWVVERIFAWLRCYRRLAKDASAEPT